MTLCRAGRLAIAFTAVAALLAPAIWNGFPLVFADTGGYLARPYERSLEIGRSAFYGAWLVATQGFRFWPVAVAQAGLTVWVTLLTLRVLGVLRPATAVGVLALLAIASALPWYVGQLMPDIFVPLAILALTLLAFGAERLRAFESASLVALVAVAIATHMAILALALALLAFLALLRGIASSLRLLPPRLASPAAAVGFGIMLALVTNWLIAGQFAFTPGGANFVFGRLVQDGIVARYLADRCPTPEIRLCAYRDEIPDSADGWLWGWGSPFYKLGGAEGFEPDARRIVLDSVRLYPGQHLVTALRATAEQLVRLRTGEGLHSRDNEHAEKALARYAPELLPAFAASVQQHDGFHFNWLNRLHVPLALAAMLALPFVAVAASGGCVERATGSFALSIFAALVLNAAIAGVFSNPNDRYQSRVAWLAPFAMAIAALQWRDRRR